MILPPQLWRNLLHRSCSWRNQSLRYASSVNGPSWSESSSRRSDVAHDPPESTCALRLLARDSIAPALSRSLSAVRGIDTDPSALEALSLSRSSQRPSVFGSSLDQRHSPNSLASPVLTLLQQALHFASAVYRRKTELYAHHRPQREGDLRTRGRLSSTARPLPAMRSDPASPAERRRYLYWRAMVVAASLTHPG